MNNNFSLQQRSQTGNLDSKFFLRQYKPDLMARFVQIKSIIAKVKQDQPAKELGCSSSILQRYRNNRSLLSPYQMQTNSHKRKQKLQIVNMTSKEFK